MCTIEDYNKIISFEKNTSYIKTILIKNNKFESIQYFYCFLCLIIIFLPLLIRLFLFIYKNIKSKSHETDKQLIKGKNNLEIISKSTKLIQEEYHPPTWYKY